MAALGTTDISTTIVKNALGESTHNVKGLCTSTKINEWALYKPAYYGDGYDCRDGQAPINYPTYDDQYRLGDFRGYNHDAKAPIELELTAYTATGFTDATGMSTPIMKVYFGEMTPTTNNEPYWPTYVPNPEEMRLTPQLYSGESLIATGNISYIIWAANATGLTSLHLFDLSSISAGEYTAKVKQEDKEDDVFTDCGFIDGGSATYTVTRTNKFDVNCTLDDILFGSYTIRVEYSTAYATADETGTLDFEIEGTAIGTTITSTNPVIITGKTVGTGGYVNFTTAGETAEGISVVIRHHTFTEVEYVDSTFFNPL